LSKLGQIVSTKDTLTAAKT